MGSSGAGNEISGHRLRARHCLVVSTWNCEGRDQEALQWYGRIVKHECQTNQHNPAFSSPIPVLEVAMVLHEEGMRYRLLNTTVIQGANYFYLECQF